MAAEHPTTVIQLVFPFPEPERWLPVVGYVGLYEVSDLGRVRSLDRTAPLGNSRKNIRGKVLKPLFGRSRREYQHVSLWCERAGRMHTIHSLVLEAFVGPRPEGHNCNHKDGNKRNNVLNNLEWVTYRANIQHAMAQGLFIHSGENHERSHLTNAQVQMIRKRSSQGAVQRTLAQEFGVSRGAISHIVRRSTWKHLSDD